MKFLLEGPKFQLDSISFQIKNDDSLKVPSILKMLRFQKNDKFLNQQTDHILRTSQKNQISVQLDLWIKWI